MSSVEYDLDTSGGLMPQIQALIAPPVLDDSSKKKKEKERRYRRPGRTVNHDSCDSCKEGGDLICCDRCPATFHLTCHDPPLSEDDLPSGEWLCHHCKTAPEVEDVSEEDLLVTPAGPLNSLMLSSATKNPAQFTLPSELGCSVQLPGSSRKTKTKESNRSNKKKAHEMDNGIVHLPAKLCYICKKSCRHAPLISCDFCPLLFHYDCVEPPLTAQPAGRWMCPNHSEHLIDQQLLDSVSLSERVKLWDQFQGPVSQDAVKLNFVNKAGHPNPPFRRKDRLPRRMCIVVPESVVQQTHRPPEKLPTLHSALKPESISSCVFRELTTHPKQHEFLQRLISFEMAVAEHVPIAAVAAAKFENNAAESETKDNALMEDCKTRVEKSQNGAKRCRLSSGSPAIFGDPTSAAYNQDKKLFSDVNVSINYDFRRLLSKLVATEELSDEDRKVERLCAIQKLREMEAEKISSQKKINPAAPEMRARAMLVPLDMRLPPATMTYRSFTLGLGGNVDVYFPNYGHCNYVSPKHATIFYDEYTKTYELLNYSCYGTMVDCVLYSPEFIDRQPEQPPQQSLSAGVRKLAKGTPRMANTKLPVTTGNRPTTYSRELTKRIFDPCKCEGDLASIAEDNGWEGAAILHHGSLIQCGCLQFVFSITEYGVRFDAAEAVGNH